MSTLRDEIQAKIMSAQAAATASQADAASMQQDLTSLEASLPGILDQDAEALKGLIGLVVKVLGL